VQPAIRRLEHAMQDLHRYGWVREDRIEKFERRSGAVELEGVVLDVVCGNVRECAGDVSEGGVGG
jgi:hypothetical protein